MVRRIHVTYHLRAPEAVGDTVARVHDLHHRHCPVYRTVHECIDVTTEWILEPEEGK